MPATISLIPAQQYELIRDNIAVILLDELTEQATLDNTFKAPTAIFTERFFPFDKSEIPTINVCFFSGDYSNKTQTKSEGRYTFYIDCYTNSATIGANRGDALAQAKLGQLMGKCRAILENPVYNTVGLAAGTVQRVAVKKIAVVYKEQDPSALNDIVGRIVFEATATETTPLKTAIPLLLEGTTAKLYDTELGYYFGTLPTP